MLFLGAGASSAFGIGDLTDWTKKVDNELDKSDYGPVKKHIVETLSRANSRMVDSRFFESEEEIDLEVIISVIDFLLDPNTTLQRLGPVAMYINELNVLKEQYNQTPREELLTIKNLIESIIVHSCNNYDFENAKDYYHDFFGFLKGLTPTYINALGVNPRKQLFNYVATTNYDLILERYDKDSQFPEGHFLRRGFSRGGYCWNEPYLDLEANEARIEYLKLHGSIDWWIRERDRKTVPRESPESLMGERYTRRSMIYPIYEKTCYIRTICIVVQ
jgi:hypothetical protein